MSNCLTIRSAAVVSSGKLLPLSDAVNVSSGSFLTEMVKAQARSRPLQLR